MRWRSSRTGERRDAVAEAHRWVDIDFEAPGLNQTCVMFSDARKRGLSPATPVYNAVLPQMVAFGDANLGIFVRLYSFYADFVHGLTEVNQPTTSRRPMSGSDRR
jgi:hypothetical protein